MRTSLDGLPREHRAVPWGRSGRRVRALFVLGPVGLAVVMGLLGWAAQGGSAGVVVGAPWVVWVGGSFVASRRSSTVLEDDGVRVSNGITRPRWYPWSDVVAVLVPRSRTAAAGLRVRGRRDVALPHVTAEVAGRLGERLGVTVEQHPFRHVSPGRGPVPGLRDDDRVIG